MSAAKEPSAQIPQHFELLDAAQLAERLRVPKSWIFEQIRSRASDPLPHLALGRYRRFRWNSPELNSWLSRRIRQ
jgi:predicted DNA-binding transcriptional regulator AlpA